MMYNLCNIDVWLWKFLWFPIHILPKRNSKLHIYSYNKVLVTFSNWSYSLFKVVTESVFEKVEKGEKIHD